MQPVSSGSKTLVSYQTAQDGLSLEGEFHSDQWGDFRSYFRFTLSSAGKIVRLDIGQA